jgi:predicted DCC family thiol-disulfide oxidoreductase YuxK
MEGSDEVPPGPASPYNEPVAMFPRLIVLIDGECPMCRRLAGRLSRIDWLHRLSFEDGSKAEVRERFAPGLDEATALTAMQVIAPDGSRRAGFDGFVRIAGAVPLLWVPGLIGALPGISTLGRAVYHLVAANRSRGRCSDAVCAR